ncbi:hypothetical protein SBV1_2010018 [Verrucomicrobia bacterium]|nr:hypothetical protein SBV1_2010018 [Verrucomicrobiota bacterium]
MSFAEDLTLSPVRARPAPALSSFALCHSLGFRHWSFVISLPLLPLGDFAKVQAIKWRFHLLF